MCTGGTLCSYGSFSDHIYFYRIVEEKVAPEVQYFSLPLTDMITPSTDVAFSDLNVSFQLFLL